MALIRYWHKYMIVISVIANSRTTHTKPISVPVVWPDSGGSNQNFNRESFTQTNHRTPSNYNIQSNRRIEAINERPNSDFNRLVFNRIGHNLQNDNAQAYVDYVDRTERLTNSFAAQGASTQNDGKNKLVFDDVQSRTKFLIKKKLKKKKKKKICLPVGHGYGKADTLRTLYDINVIFADINVNDYDTVGGYGCKPLYGQNSGHGSQGGHGSHGSHGSHGGHGSNHQTSSHHGSTNYGGSTDSVVDTDYDYVNQNDHGSLIQTDDYDHESSEPSHNSHGSNNLFGGLFHGTTNTNNNNNNYQHGNGHGGNGGPLGFFGQGGLFDFSSNGQRPQTSGALGDSIDDTVKPVIEINVPDTIQDVVQGNWRPGNLVGGIQNSVSGFIQQVSNRPGEAIRQINREISSIFRSFTDLF